jgi:gamma-glutamylputrescine oxidase
MKAVFPNLMHKKIMQAWSGRIGITVNRLPDFGKVSDTAIYVQGYSGHGVAFSGVAAHILSEAATGNNKRFNQLIKVPHMPFPGGPLRTPILALGMGWYKMKDYFQI